MSVRSLVSAVFLGAVLAGVSPARAIEKSVPWPRATLKQAKIREAEFAAFESFVFDPKAPHTTDSLVVIRGGKLVFEKYARGFTAEMPHLGWSVTKSAAAMLLGIAEKEGKLSRKDSVVDRVSEAQRLPPSQRENWAAVTLGHLASMSSGIEWNEGYEGKPFPSHVIAMLYRKDPRHDMGAYRLEVSKRVAPPGERLNYSSGDTNLLMLALARSMDPKEIETYPWRKLFYPIQASSFVLERDGVGTYVGSSFLHGTPQDFARLGELMLRDGRWGGQQVVPAEWVRTMRSPSPALSHLRLDHKPSVPYGYGWWLNQPAPQAQMGKAISAAPASLYWAEGHLGQFIFVLPEKDLVVVRMAQDPPGKTIDRERFWKLLMEALP